MIFFLAVGLLSACLDEKSGQKNQENKQKTTKNSQNNKGGRTIIDAGSNAQYQGKPGRLMIVSKNTVYTDEFNVLFDSIFNAKITPYYPSTPYFEIFQRTRKKFRSLSTRLRNVIDLAVDTTLEKGKPTMHIYENYYAKTQMYTKLRAHDINDLYALVKQEINYLFNVYERQEWKREFYRHQRKKSKSTNAKLKSNFGIQLDLPSKYSYESINDEYGIILFPDRSRQMDMKSNGNISTSKTNFIQSGVMIYQYPCPPAVPAGRLAGAAFEDSIQLKPDELMRMRDTILKYNARHEMEGVYMGTQDHPAVIPVHERLRINGVEGYQFRGLFKFTGESEPSGGHFWSFQFKHPNRNTIVAISGYIDAPPTMSPSFDINRIRAVIYSLKVTE